MTSSKFQDPRTQPLPVQEWLDTLYDYEQSLAQEGLLNHHAHMRGARFREWMLINYSPRDTLTPAEFSTIMDDYACRLDAQPLPEPPAEIPYPQETTRMSKFDLAIHFYIRLLIVGTIAVMAYLYGAGA